MVSVLVFFVEIKMLSEKFLDFPSDMCQSLNMSTIG